ncbi:MAG: hypothetical protein J6Q67_01045 [Clostridia bacterium]|nr:hypothetical protein [Clostridia bacterium]
MKRKKQYKGLKIMLRTAFITMFVICCGVVAIYFMGNVYSAVEQTAFGRESKAIEFKTNNTVTFFGKDYYFPVYSFIEKVIHIFKKYSPGTVKLLGGLVETVEELIKTVIVL